MLVLSTPTVVPWFPLLPVTAPTQKSQSSQQKENKVNYFETKFIAIKSLKKHYCKLLFNLIQSYRQT